MKLLYKKILLWVLLLLHVSLIFSFSLQNAEKSTVLSKGITDTINSTEQIEESLRNEKDDDHLNKYKSEHTIKKLTERNYMIAEKVIRKLAHVTLFFILGIFVNLLIRAYGTGILFSSVISPLFAAAIGFFDESIQFCSKGRAGLLSDVFIDITGAIIASIFFFVGGKIYEKIKEKRIKVDS